MHWLQFKIYIILSYEIVIKYVYNQFNTTKDVFGLELIYKVLNFTQISFSVLRIPPTTTTDRNVTTTYRLVLIPEYKKRGKTAVCV